MPLCKSLTGTCSIILAYPCVVVWAMKWCTCQIFVCSIRDKFAHLCLGDWALQASMSRGQKKIALMSMKMENGQETSMQKKFEAAITMVSSDGMSVWYFCMPLLAVIYDTSLCLLQMCADPLTLISSTFDSLTNSHVWFSHKYLTRVHDRAC